MCLFGFERGPLCVLTGVECGTDAVLSNTPENGLLHSRVVWQSEKGEWGYSRAIRWFFAEGLSDGAAQYRAWRESLGEVVTLEQKKKHTPELEKLIGAADLWLWDDNNMNRLYARPEEPEKTPRDVRKIAGDLEALGMDRILWNSFEGETPEDCAFLKSKGFLVGKYDIYRDVLPKPEIDQIIPYRVKRSVNTKYWPGIVRMERDGQYGKAWRLHGLDGKLHFQNAVCDIPALKLTMENVPPDVERVGYNSRFIDVQAGSTLQECYHPMHPATRSDSLRYINNQLRFLADIGLVCGVEVGCEAAVGTFHFSDTSVNDEAYCVAPLLINQFGVSDVFNVLLLIMGQGGGHDGCIQQAGYFADDGVVGHADAHFLAVAEDFGQACRPVQDEGEGTRQVPFHQFESVVVHFGIFADAAQVVADDGQVVLFGVDAFQLADALDGTLFQPMAAQGIACVGGINENTSIVQHIHHPLKVGGIVVLIIEFEEHKSALFGSAVQK